MNSEIKRARKILSASVSGAMLIALSMFVAAEAVEVDKAENVILMISDGQGFNAIRATECYTGTKGIYEGFGQRLAMQTHSAGKRGGYVGKPYDPSRMANDFKYATIGAADSASAATAMYTGVKTYDYEVNHSPDGQTLTTYFEKAARAGKSIGAVSSVEFTNATPAAVFGHNKSRKNCSAMALEAIYGSNPNPDNNNYDAGNYHGNLRVIMGTGHPLYNPDGEAQSPSYTCVGGSAAWKELLNGVNGWNFIESRQEFKDYANDLKSAKKLFGIARNISTLQQDRKNPTGDFDPMLQNQPTLVEMTNAALNILDDDPDGFALMIEGGAIDWAAHDNQLDRLIEEQIDFNNAVNAIVDYLNANTNGNNWGNTLLIVTADHETGYLWGDGEGSFFDVNRDGKFTSGVDYAHIRSRGPNNLPGAVFHSDNHSNSLVPLFAKGVCSANFNDCVIGEEPNLRPIYDLDENWTGKYIDNTCASRIMESASLAAEQ